VVVDLDQVPAAETSVEGSSSESNIPITDLMKKRKAHAFFDKSSSATEEAKKIRKDIPDEGTKKTDVPLPTAAREVSRKPPVAPNRTEVSKKPPMAPSKTIVIPPSSDVVILSPEKQHLCLKTFLLL